MGSHSRSHQECFGLAVKKKRAKKQKKSGDATNHLINATDYSYITSMGTLYIYPSTKRLKIFNKSNFYSWPIC